tara:strand:+ start:2306 stop:2734 length:429 start_codon:yes stop_codon:yes gene_type:complete
MIIYHNHHIIPKHAGGSNDPSNIIRLTIFEHAEAHRKLYVKYGNEFDRIAWQGLSKMITKEEIISQSQQYWKNKKLSKNHKKAISQSMQGKKKSTEHVKKQTTNHKAKKRKYFITEKTRKKLSLAAKKQWKEGRGHSKTSIL